MNYVCFGYHLVNKQWGTAFTANSNNGVISVNLPISSKINAITTNILKSTPDAPQAISNAYVNSNTTTNKFFICHNLGVQQYAVLYAIISFE